MNGTLIPHTPIAVDFWKIRDCPHARIFFLTHLHGDHITGLTSSWSYPIYCSEITAKLLVQRYGIKEDLIHTLQTESAEIIYLDNEHKEQMTVTALDANHCPGAVMFLMQGYFGTILHTGDFRYSPDMINQSILSEYEGKVDILYLDNTYCSSGCVFPTKDEATSKIIEIIEKHPNNDVLIAMRNLGKENLLYEIAMHFQEWISVPDKFYRTLEILEAPDVFDVDSSNHRIRIVPFHKINNRFVEMVNKERETIVILPTALYCGIEATPYENNDKVFVVPYSDHSSYTELVEFVSFIKPMKIMPIVKSNSRGPFGLSVADRADMTCFDKYTSSGWNGRIEIPISVQAFMYCKTHQVLPVKKKGQKRKMKVRAQQTKKLKRGIAYDSPISGSKASNKIPVLSSKGKSPRSVSEHTGKGPITFSMQKEESAIPVTKQKASKNQISTFKQKEEEYSSKDDKENSGKDFSHVRQLLFDQVAVKRSKVDSHSNKIQEEKTETIKTESKTNKKEIVIKSYSEKHVGFNMRAQNEVEKDKQIDVNNEGSLDDQTNQTEGNNEVQQNKEYTSKSLCKRPKEKIPLQFVCTNKDLAFDNVIGMRTYKSKSNIRLRSVNDVNISVTNDVEDSKMNETAKWVLDSSKYSFIPDVERNTLSDEHGQTNASLLEKRKGISAISGKSKNNKLKSLKQSDGKETSCGRVKNRSTLNVSGNLKQTTLSHYATETKSAAKSKAAAATSQDQEICIATKLCTGSRDIEESVTVRETIQNGEVKENETQVNCEREDNFVISSDSECEDISEQKTAGKKSFVAKFANKGDVRKADERKYNTHKKNSCRAKGEFFYEMNSFDNSIIAQVGTQVPVPCFNVSIDHEINERQKRKLTVKAKHKNGKCEYLNQQSHSDNPDNNCENSFTNLNYTTENEGAQCRNDMEKKENTKLSKEYGACQEYEDRNFSVPFNTGPKGMATGTEGIQCTKVDSKVDSESVKYSNNEANVSTLVNKGSQKEALVLSNVKQTVTVETNCTRSKIDELKCHQVTDNKQVQEDQLWSCRDCELDAFEQVIDNLEIEDLDKVLEESPSKNYDFTQRKHKKKCKQMIFVVKPVNEI